MIELLPLAIGIGLAVSLLFTEIFGIATGGMVVPGYIAMYLTRPLDVALTLGGGFITFALVHSLSSILVVYGRRRTVLMILVGYLVGMSMRFANLGSWLGTELESSAAGIAEAASHTTHVSPEAGVIGFIIPGLIAIWLDRQGVVETIASLLTASVVVRMIMVLVVGSELRQ